jgi:hypothetical protein
MRHSEEGALANHNSFSTAEHDAAIQRLTFAIGGERRLGFRAAEQACQFASGILSRIISPE